MSAPDRSASGAAIRWALRVHGVEPRRHPAGMRLVRVVPSQPQPPLALVELAFRYADRVLGLNRRRTA